MSSSLPTSEVLLITFLVFLFCRSRLFSHVDDPFLDDPLPREYVLYLRPSGPLLQQLSHFWQQSRLSCGKNKAHNIFPHITLCQFFMVSACDYTVSAESDALFLQHALLTLTICLHDV